MNQTRELFLVRSRANNDFVKPATASFGKIRFQYAFPFDQPGTADPISALHAWNSRNEKYVFWWKLIILRRNCSEAPKAFQELPTAQARINGILRIVSGARVAPNARSASIIVEDEQVRLRELQRAPAMCLKGHLREYRTYQQRNVPEDDRVCSSPRTVAGTFPPFETSGRLFNGGRFFKGRCAPHKL